MKNKSPIQHRSLTFVMCLFTANFFIFICLQSCAERKQELQGSPAEIAMRIYEQDSVYEVLQDHCDSITQSCTQALTKATIVITNKNRLIDSLRLRLQLSNMKIEKAKYYVNICKKNKTQLKFLVGWLDNRALAE